MDLSWLWYGFIIFVCLALMVTVMWLTDKGIEKPRVCPKCKSPYWDKPRKK